MVQAAQPSIKATPRATNREKVTQAALANFDKSPDSALLRVHAVAAWRGCSVPTVWRHSANGLLPKPVKSGGITGWRVGDLRAIAAA